LCPPGLLEASDALAGGTGKGTFFVSEQLTFQERLRNGGAVDLDHGAGGTATPSVDEVGHDFFTDATFAGDEDAGVRSGHKGSVAEEGLHLRAGGYDVRRQGRQGLGKRAAAGLAGGLAHALKQFVQIDRLGQVAQGAVPHGAHGFADVGVGGHQQNGQGTVLLAGAAEGFQTGQPWHADVGDEQVDGLAVEECQGFFSGAGGECLVALAAQE